MKFFLTPIKFLSHESDDKNAALFVFGYFVCIGIQHTAIQQDYIDCDNAFFLEISSFDAFFLPDHPRR